MKGSDTITNDIQIVVYPQYSPAAKNEPESHFMFVYTINIINHSDKRIKLVSRHWEIINADGDVEIVEGPGVVGLFPELKAGESFAYTSYANLDTKWGTMEGYYTFIDEYGDTFDVQIGRFYLAVPQEIELI